MRAPDDRRTEVVPGIAQANLAGVERHPHAHFPTRGPRLLRERALHVERRGHRVRRPREGADHTVAFTLFDRAHAAVQRDGRFEQLVVTGDRDRRLVGTRLPELRRALDVGEQEGHRAGRELGFDGFGHIRVCQVHFRVGHDRIVRAARNIPHMAYPHERPARDRSTVPEHAPERRAPGIPERRLCARFSRHLSPPVRKASRGSVGRKRVHARMRGMSE